MCSVTRIWLCYHFSSYLHSWWFPFNTGQLNWLPSSSFLQRFRCIFKIWFFTSHKPSPWFGLWSLPEPSPRNPFVDNGLYWDNSIPQPYFLWSRELTLPSNQSSCHHGWYNHPIVSLNIGFSPWHWHIQWAIQLIMSNEENMMDSS